MIYPSNVERLYLKALLQGTNKIIRETRKQLRLRSLYKLDASHEDGYSEDLTALIAEIILIAGDVFQGTILRTPEVYSLVNQWQDRQWRLTVKAGTGIDLPSSQTIPPHLQKYGNVTDPNKIRARFGLEVDVYRSEPWLAKLQTNWVAQNTSLIKTIAPQHMARVETIIRQGILSGESPRSLADKITRAGEITQRRAKVIARDQISKANSELTMYRQIDLGIDEYIWHTSLDERVRPTHKAHEGKTYKWSAAPANTGHPGHDVMCRCYASPKFKPKHGIE